MNDKGQVILVTSVAIALLIISLASVIYTTNTYDQDYIKSKYNLGDYDYYNIRNTYKNILKSLEANQSIENPFNSSEIEIYENEISNFCSKRGYMISFQNKSYNPTTDTAKFTIIFTGENLKYYERIEYELK